MPAASAQSRLLTRKQIRLLAGDISFVRGEDYFARGQVSSLVVHGDTLSATVVGTDHYTVRLSADKGTLSHRCSCPVGVDGTFCKHCVAVALAWIESAQPRSGHGAVTTPLVKLDDLRGWLVEQPAATLAGYLLEAAERDDRLREKLLRAAARANAEGIDFSAYRQSIDRATRTAGFVDYYGAGSYAEGVREAIEPLGELLADTPEAAAVVIDMAEFALRRVEAAIEQADDSNGEIGTVLKEIQDLHLDACRVARPDPAELARRLFAWEINDHWDVFYNAAETYAEILGASGLAVYRRLAESAWNKLPSRGPDARDHYDSSRFRLTSIMEALARQTGDVDALAAIKAKDLSSAYQYLTIAELYREAKRFDDALAWAERGLEAFPKTDDMRLVEFIAEAYHRQQRSDEALALIWRPFDARLPSLADYQRLKKHADLAGAWPHWRERALTDLRRRLTSKSSDKSRRLDVVWKDSVRDTLVRVFLWEKDAESAWATGNGHPLHRDLSLELAAAREQAHPADAIPIYLSAVEASIERKSNRDYEEAVRRLRQIKALYLRLNQTGAWTATLESLRLQHKAKRNFIALAAGL